MTLLKKLKDEWVPSENKSLKVGDIFDFPGNFDRLVREGSAQLVDENGNELPMPGTIFTCAICYAPSDSLKAYTDHVLAHAPKETVKETVTDEAKSEVEDIKARRIAALEKARAAKAAKK